MYYKKVYSGNIGLEELGGGNHFLELDQDEEGNLYAVVHSGSRRLGKEVTEYYLTEGQRESKKRGISVPYEMTYLEGALMEEYLQDMQVVQEFAGLNRHAILDELAKGMKWKIQERTECVHNYIDAAGDNMILRQGPAECELAVKKLYDSLKKEFPDIEMQKSNVKLN